MTIQSRTVALATVAAAGLAGSAAATSLTLAPSEELTAEIGLTPALAMAALQDDADAPAEESPWSVTVTAGGSASFGNSDKQDAFIRAQGVREINDQRTTVGAGYYYGAADGDRTDNRWNIRGRHEWLMSESPWSYFAQAKFEYDEFQSWEYRISAAAGVGYDFIDTEKTTLTGRIGLGASREFNSPNEDVKPEGLLGLELRHQLTEATEIRASTEIYPDLGDMGEFRTFSTAGLTTLLDDELNMSLTIGLEHEYQSEVMAPTKENDFRIQAGLQFSF